MYFMWLITLNEVKVQLFYMINVILIKCFYGFGHCFGFSGFGGRDKGQEPSKK